MSNGEKHIKLKTPGHCVEPFAVSLLLSIEMELWRAWKLGGNTLLRVVCFLALSYVHSFIHTIFHFMMELATQKNSVEYLLIFINSFLSFYFYFLFAFSYARLEPAVVGHIGNATGAIIKIGSIWFGSECSINGRFNERESIVAHNDIEESTDVCEKCAWV